MKNITDNFKITRTTDGGAKVYICPWGDYCNTSYWKTYSHTIAHAYRKGYFAIPITMIRIALGR